MSDYTNRSKDEMSLLLAERDEEVAALKVQLGERDVELNQIKIKFNQLEEKVNGLIDSSRSEITQPPKEETTAPGGFQAYLIEKRISDLEQYSRRDTAVAYGVVVEDDKMPTTPIICAALNDCIGSTVMTPGDVSISHLLPGKAVSKARPIIIKFVRREKKMEVMSLLVDARRSKADVKGGATIYLNHNLTPRRAQLAFELRRQQRDGEIAKHWVTAAGKLYCRLTWDSPPIDCTYGW